MNRTLAIAKHDFEIGYLNNFVLERAPMTEYWQIVLGSGNSLGFLVDARTKERRLFKSLDGAISALTQIGFKVDFLTND